MSNLGKICGPGKNRTCVSRLIFTDVSYIFRKYLENLTYHGRGDSIIKFSFRGEEVPSKCKIYKQGEGRLCHWECFLPISFSLSKYLVYRLVAIISRFFVGFVKMPALIKISILRSYISLSFLFGLYLIRIVDFWVSFERKAAFRR